MDGLAMAMDGLVVDGLVVDGLDVGAGGGVPVPVGVVLAGGGVGGVVSGVGVGGWAGAGSVAVSAGGFVSLSPPADAAFGVGFVDGDGWLEVAGQSIFLGAGDGGVAPLGQVWFWHDRTTVWVQWTGGLQMYGRFPAELTDAQWDQAVVAGPLWVAGLADEVFERWADEWFERVGEVPADGDCFFHTLLAVLPAEFWRDRLGIDGSVVGLRGWLADRLTEDLNSGDSWFAPFLTVPEDVFGWGDAEWWALRNGWVRQIREPGQWNNQIGDLAAHLFVRSTGVPLHVYMPGWAVPIDPPGLPVGFPGWRNERVPVVLHRQHWQAVRYRRDRQPPAGGWAALQLPDIPDFRRAWHANGQPSPFHSVPTNPTTTNPTTSDPAISDPASTGLGGGDFLSAVLAAAPVEVQQALGIDRVPTVSTVESWLAGLLMDDLTSAEAGGQSWSSGVFVDRDGAAEPDVPQQRLIDWILTGQANMATADPAAAGSAADVFVRYFVTVSGLPVQVTDEGGNVTHIDPAGFVTDPTHPRIRLYRWTDGRYQALPSGWSSLPPNDAVTGFGAVSKSGNLGIAGRHIPVGVDVVRGLPDDGRGVKYSFTRDRLWLERLSDGQKFERRISPPFTDVELHNARTRANRAPQVESGWSSQPPSDAVTGVGTISKSGNLSIAGRHIPVGVDVVRDLPDDKRRVKYSVTRDRLWLERLFDGQKFARLFSPPFTDAELHNARTRANRAPQVESGWSSQPPSDAVTGIGTVTKSGELSIAAKRIPVGVDVVRGLPDDGRGVKYSVTRDGLWLERLSDGQRFERRISPPLTDAELHDARTRANRAPQVESGWSSQPPSDAVTGIGTISTKGQLGIAGRQISVGVDVVRDLPDDKRRVKYSFTRDGLWLERLFDGQRFEMLISQPFTDAELPNARTRANRAPKVESGWSSQPPSDAVTGVGTISTKGQLGIAGRQISVGVDVVRGLPDDKRRVKYSFTRDGLWLERLFDGQRFEMLISQPFTDAELPNARTRANRANRAPKVESGWSSQPPSDAVTGVGTLSKSGQLGIAGRQISVGVDVVRGLPDDGRRVKYSVTQDGLWLERLFDGQKFARLISQPLTDAELHDTPNRAPQVGSGWSSEPPPDAVEYTGTVTNQGSLRVGRRMFYLGKAVVPRDASKDERQAKCWYTGTELWVQMIEGGHRVQVSLGGPLADPAWGGASVGGGGLGRVGALPLPQLMDSDGGEESELQQWLAIDAVADPAASWAAFDAVRDYLTSDAAGHALDALIAAVWPGGDRLWTDRALLALARQGQVDFGYQYLLSGDRSVAPLLRVAGPEQLWAWADLVRSAGFGEGRATLLEAVASALIPGTTESVTARLAASRGEIDVHERIAVVHALSAIAAAVSPQLRTALNKVATTLLGCPLPVTLM
ncbi:OTU domain-containing protein [Dactylosporangium sp. CA-152071]|uniref:OTU domain-containing protein n=1 Tax=Dactylosporangium sp. CA-152071 TaxID=3239933 RepID=UPI003D91FDFA